MGKNDDKFVKFCPICNITRQNMEWCDDEKYKEFSKGYWNVCIPNENTKICPACNKGILEDSIITHNEFNIIEDVSDSNRQFLETMIKLKEEDPIEYQLKLSQFKTQFGMQEQQKIEKQQQESTNTAQIRCPQCGSTNIAEGTRGFTLTTGFLGSGNFRYVCKKCGNKWKPGGWKEALQNDLSVK